MSRPKMGMLAVGMPSSLLPRPKPDITFPDSLMGYGGTGPLGGSTVRGRLCRPFDGDDDDDDDVDGGGGAGLEGEGFEVEVLGVVMFGGWRVTDARKLGMFLFS